MHAAALLLLLQTFVSLAFASPVVSEDVEPQQLVLSAPRPTGQPTYEHGEMPPREDTVGWVDPRLNGGRFIDVSTVNVWGRHLMDIGDAVHDKKTGRAVEYYHILPF